jgi:hypothetical protein
MALAGVTVFLGALAVWLWRAGLGLHHAYAAAAACHPASSMACADLISSFNGMGGFLADGYVLLAVLALIGAFAGAQVLARELDTGTFRYAWTQGFGRWRWALAKLVLLAVVVGAGGGRRAASRSASPWSARSSRGHLPRWPGKGAVRSRTPSAPCSISASTGTRS